MDPFHISYNGPLIRYVKLRVAHAPGTFSPPPRVGDPDMHHGTCVTHVPWCILGSLTSGFLWSRWRKNVPSIPGACAKHNFTYLVRGPCTSSISHNASLQNRNMHKYPHFCSGVVRCVIFAYCAILSWVSCGGPASFKRQKHFLKETFYCGEIQTKPLAWFNNSTETYLPAQGQTPPGAPFTTLV